MVKTDGTVPSPAGICLAAATFETEKKVRGRKPGQNKTSKAEDKVIMKTFHKLRPPGLGLSFSLPCSARFPKLAKHLTTYLHVSGCTQLSCVKGLDLNTSTCCFQLLLACLQTWNNSHVDTISQLWIYLVQFSKL